MKVWTDKEGKKITASEFLERWKEGIKKATLEMTPKQQVLGQLISSYMVLIGLICGIIVAIFKAKSLWWLIIILVGSFGVTLFQTVGFYQKYKLFANLDNMLKGGTEQNEQERFY